ncbi:uncharacterized protein N7482_009358 [Penicillium canariense]|uniref:Uncharacterized protein n=1 Tax=Penicillium canariense TaxID=189055 RepID=A0A9W9HQ85_9EURO|nr:uncharacterized protein N7482_009358 [Penicillium canariense]KAJ5152880.1 hypothetical protein N7482_009358 [Penicillium canariense]
MLKAGGRAFRCPRAGEWDGRVGEQRGARRSGLRHGGISVGHGMSRASKGWAGGGNCSAAACSDKNPSAKPVDNLSLHHRSGADALAARGWSSVLMGRCIEDNLQYVHALDAIKRPFGPMLPFLADSSAAEPAGPSVEPGGDHVFVVMTGNAVNVGHFCLRHAAYPTDGGLLLIMRVRRDASVGAPGGPIASTVLYEVDRSIGYSSIDFGPPRSVALCPCELVYLPTEGPGMHRRGEIFSAGRPEGPCPALLPTRCLCPTFRTGNPLQIDRIDGEGTGREKMSSIAIVRAGHQIDPIANRVALTSREEWIWT